MITRVGDFITAILQMKDWGRRSLNGTCPG